MPVDSIYSQSNQEIALTIGQRLEKRRLHANISQQVMADQLGVTPKTYRSIIKGQGKLVHYVAILRILGELPLAEQFVPESQFSPMALLDTDGRQRQRASRNNSVKEGKDLGW